jgi:rod shape-determining protein MreD
VIPTPGALLRVAALVFGAVILQVSGIGQVRLLGGNLDLSPVLVAALALYAGSVPAMVVGFFTGLMIDLSVGNNVGASSLVLTAVGYGAGRYCELRQPAHGLAPIPLVAGAAGGYVVGFAAVSFMLEIEASVSALVLREMLVTVLLDTLVALPAFALARRVLRPVLAVDPLERRRRRRREPRPPGPLGLRGLEV